MRSASEAGIAAQGLLGRSGAHADVGGAGFRRGAPTALDSAPASIGDLAAGQVLLAGAGDAASVSAQGEAVALAAFVAHRTQRT